MKLTLKEISAQKKEAKQQLKLDREIKSYEFRKKLADDKLALLKSEIIRYEKLKVEQQRREFAYNMQLRKLREEFIVIPQYYKDESYSTFESNPELSNLSYSEKLKLPEWLEKRQDILRRDSFTCLVCQNFEQLHVHHRVYVEKRLPWEYDNSCLATLCKKCHESIHASDVNTKIMEIQLTEILGEPIRKYEQSTAYYEKAIEQPKVKLS